MILASTIARREFISMSLEFLAQPLERQCAGPAADRPAQAAFHRQRFRKLFYHSDAIHGEYFF